MPSDKRATDRRSVLKTAGVALAGLTGMTGAASAAPGNGRGRGRGRPDHAGERGPPAFVQDKNGRLELGVSKSEWGTVPPEADIPSNGGPVPYSVVKEVVEAWNEAVENGQISPSELDGPGTGSEGER